MLNIKLFSVFSTDSCGQTVEQWWAVLSDFFAQLNKEISKKYDWVQF